MPQEVCLIEQMLCMRSKRHTATPKSTHRCCDTRQAPSAAASQSACSHTEALCKLQQQLLAPTATPCRTAHLHIPHDAQARTAAPRHITWHCVTACSSQPTAACCAMLRQAALQATVRCCSVLCCAPCAMLCSAVLCRQGATCSARSSLRAACAEQLAPEAGLVAWAVVCMCSRWADAAGCERAPRVAGARGVRHWCRGRKETNNWLLLCCCCCCVASAGVLTCLSPVSQSSHRYLGPCQQNPPLWTPTQPATSASNCNTHAKLSLIPKACPSPFVPPRCGLAVTRHTHTPVVA
jgi:hypothetical protein